jgi:hypothetical protein
MVSLALLVVTGVRLEGSTVSEVDRDHDVSRQWIYTSCPACRSWLPRLRPGTTTGTTLRFVAMRALRAGSSRGSRAANLRRASYSSGATELSSDEPLRRVVATAAELTGRRRQSRRGRDHHRRRAVAHGVASLCSARSDLRSASRHHVATGEQPRAVSPWLGGEGARSRGAVGGYLRASLGSAPCTGAGSPRGRPPRRCRAAVRW